ncbi:MAG: DUF3841 domain-containing protein [Butyrivibrio sp.]|uniref:DUF3841 domain-containing protein n=1 Tax=Butyrivibrio sp. TaxID=28121 RepID=UPI001B11F48D|nr:DUF3841 domain-containing protein [Butyrivibrio sp.]MBO6241960.1 DUF3841 domain-containing protein [Butyrivibrio sp.]
MRLYSFQDQQAVDAINALDDDTYMFTDFSKSHLYRSVRDQQTLFEAYRWMAEKLAQKTDIYIETEQHGKIPPLPWWAWYKVDGKCEEPSTEYEMTSWGKQDFSKEKTYLLTLEVPDEMVLLSDINAFYNCLEGQPCFDYMSEEDEEKAREDFAAKCSEFAKTRETKLGEELERLIYDSWENIFIVDGSRRLKTINTGHPLMPVIEEKYDVQAAFPVMMKRFIVDMKVVIEGC